MMTSKKIIASCVVMTLLTGLTGNTVAFAQENTVDNNNAIVNQRQEYLKEIVEPEIQAVNVADFCERESITSDEAAKIDRIEVIEVNEANQNDVLEYLGININNDGRDADKKEINKIYTITYDEPLTAPSVKTSYQTRTHIIEYNPLTNGFKDVNGKPVIGDVFFTGVMCVVSDLIPKQLVLPANIFATLVAVSCQ